MTPAQIAQKAWDRFCDYTSSCSPGEYRQALEELSSMCDAHLGALDEEEDGDA